MKITHSFVGTLLSWWVFTDLCLQRLAENAVFDRQNTGLWRASRMWKCIIKQKKKEPGTKESEMVWLLKLWNPERRIIYFLQEIVITRRLRLLLLQWCFKKSPFGKLELYEIILKFLFKNWPLNFTLYEFHWNDIREFFF